MSPEHSTLAPWPILQPGLELYTCLDSLPVAFAGFAFGKFIRLACPIVFYEVLYEFDVLGFPILDFRHFEECLGINLPIFLLWKRLVLYHWNLVILCTYVSTRFRRGDRKELLTLIAGNLCVIKNL